MLLCILVIWHYTLFEVWPFLRELTNPFILLFYFPGDITSVKYFYQNNKLKQFQKLEFAN